MLCTVALRRIAAQAPGVLYALRIAGKTAVGPAGTGGEETKSPLSAEAVRATLQCLGLSETDLATADAIMNDGEHNSRFRYVTEDAQIPFELLEAADVYLFD